MLQHLRVVPGVNRLIACKQTLDACYPPVKLIQLKDFNYAQDLKIRRPNDQKIILNNSIELKNIEYKYPNSNKNIIENLDLKINKNDCICIIGNSGSGKTTLVDISFWFLKPTSWSNIIDGINTSLNNYNWRKLGWLCNSISIFDR